MNSSKWILETPVEVSEKKSHRLFLCSHLEKVIGLWERPSNPKEGNKVHTASSQHPHVEIRSASVLAVELLQLRTQASLKFKSKVGDAAS